MSENANAKHSPALISQHTPTEPSHDQVTMLYFLKALVNY